MLQTTFHYRFFLLLGILFSIVLCAQSQNFEDQKLWLKEERKSQLKSGLLSLDSQHKAQIKDTIIFSKYNLLEDLKKEKYTVDYLNESIRMGLENLPLYSPVHSGGGVGAVVGGLNLSDPKSYFMAAKLRRRNIKMRQITTWVYSTE